MSAIWNSLNVHNFPIFQPILIKRLSKLMVYRALSDKTYLLLGLLSPLSKTPIKHLCFRVLRDSFLDEVPILIVIHVHV